MYDEKATAQRTPNDRSSSPNPVLFGSMGLMTLYDEIWFACRSLCPQSMRELPYVKYLDVDAAKLDLSEAGFNEDVARISALTSMDSPVILNDMFSEGFGPGMTAYLGGQFRTDNHTHAMSFLGTEINGNPGIRELIIDQWLIDRFRNLNLELVLNPLTARLGFGNATDDGLATVQALGLADGVLTFGSLYDITGKDGPYHPCIEEVRGDELLTDFRLWMTDKTSRRLDNYDVRMIQTEVDAGIRTLMRESIRKNVAYQSLSATAAKVAKDEIVGKIPAASALITINDAIESNREATANRFKAFIALTRDTVEHARLGATS
jgi:hypothetical protein